MEKGETFDIYLVNEEENKAPYLFHSLENVVDYRYDTTNRPIILAKIVSNRYDGILVGFSGSSDDQKVSK